MMACITVQQEPPSSAHLPSLSLLPKSQTPGLWAVPWPPYTFSGFQALVLPLPCILWFSSLRPPGTFFSHFIQASAQVSAPKRSLFRQIYLKNWPSFLCTFTLVSEIGICRNASSVRPEASSVLFTAMHPASNSTYYSVDTQYISTE